MMPDQRMRNQAAGGTAGGDCDCGDSGFRDGAFYEKVIQVKFKNSFLLISSWRLIGLCGTTESRFHTQSNDGVF